MPRYRRDEKGVRVVPSDSTILIIIIFTIVSLCDEAELKNLPSNIYYPEQYLYARECMCVDTRKMEIVG